MQISLNDFEPEAASQLVRAHWPLLESLTVSFRFVDDIVIKMLIKGKWPLLKELLVDIRTSLLLEQHIANLGWDKQRLQAWQNVEEDCRQTCRDRWRQLESLQLPCAQDMSCHAGF